MRSCSERPRASRPVRRPTSLSRVSARFSKNAGRISRERGSRDKTTSDAMDRARRHSDCRLVVGMLLYPYGYYPWGYPYPYPYASGYPYAAGYPYPPAPEAGGVPQTPQQPAVGTPQPLNEPVQRAPLPPAPVPQ